MAQDITTHSGSVLAAPTSAAEGAISQVLKEGRVKLSNADDTTNKAAGAVAERADYTELLMPHLGGAGYRRPGGNQAIQDVEWLASTAVKANSAMRGAISDGYANAKGGNPYNSFTPQFLAAMNGGQVPAPQVDQKAFSSTSPLSSGFVPFWLKAPADLIFPNFTILRDKLARTQGQGEFARFKPITAISGSQTGQPVVDISAAEVPSGNTFPGTNPFSLNPFGAQTANDLIVPFKYSLLSEAVTLFALLTAQGYEDLSGLASYILLLEMMQGEEYQHLDGTSVALASVATPTAATATTASGETSLSGITAGNNLYIRVTNTNYFGETTPSSAVTVSSVTWANGYVVNVSQLAGVVPGAKNWNIYVGQGTTDPGASGSHLMASGIGGTQFTLQGAVPTGTATPPTADTGTSTSSTHLRQEGFTSVLSSHAGTASGYTLPSTHVAGYYSAAIGTQLTVATLNSALASTFTEWKGTPTDLVVNDQDLANLANDILNQGAGAAAYQSHIVQSDLPGGIATGLAVSEHRNPINNSVLKMVLHPMLQQGTAYGLSWTVPYATTNVGNCWEFQAVQDYLSIAWPQTSPQLLYTILMIGALIPRAPMFSFMIQGLQINGSAPYS